jgi:hypothetical protein
LKYKKVNQIIVKGNFNLLKKRIIKDIQKKLRIADVNANKIIKFVQSRKVLGNLNKDTLGLDRLLELSEQGNELHTFFAKETRTQMFRRDVEKAMSDGTGNLDIHKFEVIYPEALKLDTAAAREIIKVVALEKLRPTLVQAISFYRQKKNIRGSKCYSQLGISISCFSSISFMGTKERDRRIVLAILQRI